MTVTVTARPPRRARAAPTLVTGTIRKRRCSARRLAPAPAAAETAAPVAPRAPPQHSCKRVEIRRWGAPCRFRPVRSRSGAASRNRPGPARPSFTRAERDASQPDARSTPTMMVAPHEGRKHATDLPNHRGGNLRGHRVREAGHGASLLVLEIDARVEMKTVTQGSLRPRERHAIYVSEPPPGVKQALQLFCPLPVHLVTRPLHIAPRVSPAIPRGPRSGSRTAGPSPRSPISRCRARPATVRRASHAQHYPRSTRASSPTTAPPCAGPAAATRPDACGRDALAVPLRGHLL